MEKTTSDNSKCFLLVAFANKLDPDQARRHVVPDLYPNCLTLADGMPDFFFFKIIDFENISRLSITRSICLARFFLVRPSQEFEGTVGHLHVYQRKRDQMQNLIETGQQIQYGRTEYTRKHI